MQVKPRKQVVYGLWLIGHDGYCRWLEWKDLRIGDEEWLPRFGFADSSDAYVFTSRKADLVKVLRYIEGKDIPKDVREQCAEDSTAHCIYPCNTKHLKIRKCILPQPEHL